MSSPGVRRPGASATAIGTAGVTPVSSSGREALVELWTVARLLRRGGRQHHHAGGEHRADRRLDACRMRLSGRRGDRQHDRIRGLRLLGGGRQVVCLPGTSLFDLECALKPIGREPHSVIGSSCIGASVIGGVCNNSGGALVRRGPAYTELALSGEYRAGTAGSNSSTTSKSVSAANPARSFGGSSAAISVKAISTGHRTGERPTGTMQPTSATSIRRLRPGSTPIPGELSKGPEAPES